MSEIEAKEVPIDNIPEDYREALSERIDSLRSTVKTDRNQSKGYLFKNTEFVTKGVVGAVLAATGKVSVQNVLILPKAKSLRINKEDVILGKYDDLITEIFGHVCRLDFNRERSLDFH